MGERRTFIEYLLYAQICTGRFASQTPKPCKNAPLSQCYRGGHGGSERRTHVPLSVPRGPAGT